MSKNISGASQLNSDAAVPLTNEDGRDLKKKKMALYSSSSKIQVPRSPKIPNMFKKMLFTVFLTLKSSLQLLSVSVHPV